VHEPHHSDPLDDIDRLFARLEHAPVPEDLTARVLTSTIAKTSSSQAALAWPWMVAGLAALCVLVVAGYQLGVTLASSDGFELLGAIFDDVGLLLTAPGDVVAALGEVVPWSLVGLAGLSAALLILASGRVVSRVPSLARARRLA
jgi:hypothetical protein